MRFDGVDDGMGRDDALGLGMARTVLAVYSLTETDRRGPPFMLGKRGTTGPSSDFWGIDPYTHGATAASFGVYLISIGIQSSPLAADTARHTHVLTTQDASTSSAAVGSSSYHIDGAAQSVTVPGRNVGDQSHAPNSTRLGTFPGFPDSTLFSGDLVLLLVWNRALTDAERAQAESWAAAQNLPVLGS